MPSSTSEFTAALVLTYSPREGAEDDGYADWVRRVDNPFFNAVPGIVRYSNWRIIKGRCDLPYAYFDILVLQDLMSFDRVWLGDEVRAFRAEWRDKWGAEPGTDSALNSHVYLLELVSGKIAGSADYVLFAPDATAGQAGEGFQEWRVVRPIKGDVRFDSLALKYVDEPGAFAEWRAGRPGVGSGALGHCFAAPDERTF